MSKQPTRPIEHILPEISHRQAHLVILGMNRALALTMNELALTAGVPHAFQFKAKLAQEVKNYVPGGIGIDEETDVIRWLLAMVDATIAVDDKG